MPFQIRVVEKNIEIAVNYYGKVYKQCKDYLIETKNPDIVLWVSESEVDNEIERLRYLDDNGVMRYPDISRGEVVSTAVCRRLAEAFLPYDIYLMHGSVVSDGRYAYMFSAPSGTGKTARTLFFLEKIPNSFVVNGDKPFLKIEKGRVLACGSPWCGKEGLNTNTMQPLRAIFLLERADETEVTELSFLDALPKLLEQTYFPSDSVLAVKTLGLLKQLEGKVKFYRFQSSYDAESVFQAWNIVKPEADSEKVDL